MTMTVVGGCFIFKSGSTRLSFVRRLPVSYHITRRKVYSFAWDGVLSNVCYRNPAV